VQIALAHKLAAKKTNVAKQHPQRLQQHGENTKDKMPNNPEPIIKAITAISHASNFLKRSLTLSPSTPNFSRSLKTSS